MPGDLDNELEPNSNPNNSNIDDDEEVIEMETPTGEVDGDAAAISQSKWWEKIYDDEDNAQTAKHLL